MRPHPPVPPPVAPGYLAGLIVAAILCFHGTGLTGAFVFDDVPAIRDNPTIRALWPLTTALSPPSDTGVGGRPLANLSLAINRALGGDSEVSYHAGNLLLHVMAALLLFGLVRRTWRAPGTGAAAAVALLWGVHPLTTGAVTYLSQRTEVLMAVCYLATVYAFRRAVDATGPGWSIVSAAACALGMLSKEVMATAPVLVLLYDRTFVAGSFREAWVRRRTYYLALGATWLLLAFALGSGLGRRSVGFGLGVTPWEYAYTECTAILLYLRLALWPSPLIFDYGPIFGGSPAAAAGLAALAGGSLVALRRRPVAGFIGAGFLLLLAPASSFVPVAEQPIAENRVYLPLALVIAGAVAAARHALRGPGARAAATAGLAALLGGLTADRNADYRHVPGLWADTARKRPENHRAHFNAGVAFLEAGKPAEAVPRLETAIRLRPQEARAHNSLGNALMELGRVAAAIPAYREAARLAPSYPTAWYNLGVALLRAGDAGAALAALGKAQRLGPPSAETWTALGNAHFALNRPADALACYEAALHLAPAPVEARYNAGNACLELGRAADAAVHLAAAAGLRPGDAEIHNQLGAALLRAGRTADAIAAFDRALRLRPDYADARDNLALARAAR